MIYEKIADTVKRPIRYPGGAMKELRCKKCNKLLLKHEGLTKIESVCTRCKTVNLYIPLEFWDPKKLGKAMLKAIKETNL